MNRHQALYDFFSSFGVPAYADSAVPAEAEFPYLTYPVMDGDFYSGETSMAVHLWFYTDTETAPNQKVFEIAKALANGGKKIIFDDGAIWLKKGTPWAQGVPDGSGDSKVKHRYLNVDMEFITSN